MDQMHSQDVGDKIEIDDDNDRLGENNVMVMTITIPIKILMGHVR